MNAAEIMILIYESDIMNTLRVRKDIIDIRKFKKLMIFKITFEENRKTLKLNKF